MKLINSNWSEGSRGDAVFNWIWNDNASKFKFMFSLWRFRLFFRYRVPWLYEPPNTCRKWYFDYDFVGFEYTVGGLKKLGHGFYYDFDTQSVIIEGYRLTHEELEEYAVNYGQRMWG